MQDDATTVWTIPVSKQTDENLRLFLAEHGVADDDIPKFIEDAVKWRVLDRAIAEIREKFADLNADQIADLIEEAVASVRDEGTSYEAAALHAAIARSRADDREVLHEEMREWLLKIAAGKFDSSPPIPD